MITKNGFKFNIVKKEWDVYFDMALVMLDEIIKNNALGKKTVMIVPVGPTEQYPILAKMVNTLKVSLKNVWFFNMDEYLISPTEELSRESTMSFHNRMNSNFYSLVDKELIMPINQRLFPEVGKEKEYDALLEKLGGADLCLGGLGINGHIAFNEPDENGMDYKSFANLGTRVLPVSRETRAVNAFGYLRGDIQGMPSHCITIGMKQILHSKRVYIALNRDWQHGIIKHVIDSDPQSKIPATLLKLVDDVTFCTCESISQGLF